MYDRALLWRATDFWREGLKPRVRKNIKMYNTRVGETRALQAGTIEYGDIEKAHTEKNLPAAFFQSVKGWFWFVKEDGYLVTLGREPDGKWVMHTRGGKQLTPPHGFLEGLERNMQLPAVMVGELVTSFTGCEAEDRGDAGRRNVLRNEQFARIHRVIERGDDPRAWVGLRVKLFAFPGSKKDVGETYVEMKEVMTSSLHNHPHIGMCRAGQLIIKEIRENEAVDMAIEIFEHVVQMGFEGIVIVNPRVRYGAKDYVDDYEELVGTFFKLKQKIVLPGAEFQKTGRIKEVWKDGKKQTEHVFTTKIDNEEVHFTDLQPRPTGHARIKYMEHVPGMGNTFPCQSGYRHMHFAQPDDMSVRVAVAGALTKNVIRDNILGVHPTVGRILNWERDTDRQMLEKLDPVLHLYNPRPFRATDIVLHPEPPIAKDPDDDGPVVIKNAGEPPAQPAPAKRRKGLSLAEMGRKSQNPDYNPGTQPTHDEGTTSALRIEALLRQTIMLLDLL